MKIPDIVSKNADWLVDRSRTAALYVYSRFGKNGFAGQTDALQTFCLFIGYPRSGHSLVGSLLDAHPNSIIANELDVLKFVKAGFTREQLNYLLLSNSDIHSKRGRTQTGYPYDVSNQWQGRYERLRVLGDKKGGMTTQRLSAEPMLLDALKTIFGVPVKFIHVVRNPFDNIATMTARTNSTIMKEIFHYFGLCQKNSLIQEIAGRENVLEIRHEDLIADPNNTLRRMLRFLNLPTESNYLEDCASIIYPSAHRSREKYRWSSLEKELVKRQMPLFSFLSGYSFEN